MAYHLGRLKRLPTFTVSRGEVQFSLRTVDPMFRFSLTRLVEDSPTPPDSSSPGAEARFAASWDTRFQQEWTRLRAAVHDIFHFKAEQRRRGSQAGPTLSRGQLTALHNDIRILLRSQAGTFIFEYYQNTLLPAAADILLEDIDKVSSDLSASLIAGWTHFYCHAVPALEAVFVHVKNQRMSIRQATLIAFRDHVLLKLMNRLEPILEEMNAEGSVPPAIRQMLLVLQSVMECYPPSEKRLKLESLVARVVSPYLGHRGLYEGGSPKPVVPSRELDVAHLRRPSGHIYKFRMLPRGRKFGNDTLDVVNKGCFDSFDTVACIRTSILTTAAVITLVFVILKIIKYHVYRHPQMHHYAIFYVSAIECLVCGASFMVGILYPQLDFTACFLKLLQFTIICHLHWSLAARTLHREDIVQHVINPVLCLYILYCTTVALMGMVDVTGTWTECMRPYWFMLSVADLSIVQLFAVAAIYVTYRTEGISSLASFKSSQRRDLWSVIIVYEFSALLAVAFDAVTRFVGSEKDGCSALFAHTQFYYSLIVVVFMVVKFLVPMWTILCVFQPVEGDTRNSEVALASRYNLDGTSDSVSSSIRGYHQYRRMFIPTEQGIANTNGIPRLPYVSEFTSLHTGFGDYTFPEIDSDSLSNGLQKKVVINKSTASATAAGLSTINEESGNISVVDSPLEGSLNSGYGGSDTPRLQYRSHNC